MGNNKGSQGKEYGHTPPPSSSSTASTSTHNHPVDNDAQNAGSGSGEERPLARFHNLTAGALTDQVNGIMLVCEGGPGDVSPPRGAFIFESCLKVEGSSTTQVNGLLVGVKKNHVNDRMPAHPGIYGMWTGCHTVETLPLGRKADPSADGHQEGQFDINANHTIQLNGGIVTSIVDNRLIIPKLSQS